MEIITIWLASFFIPEYPKWSEKMIIDAKTAKAKCDILYDYYKNGFKTEGTEYFVTAYGKDNEETECGEFEINILCRSGLYSATLHSFKTHCEINSDEYNILKNEKLKLVPVKIRKDEYGYNTDFYLEITTPKVLQKEIRECACDVCFETNKEYYCEEVFKCTHNNFCEDCVKAMNKSNNLKCPLCRASCNEVIAFNIV